MQITKTRVTGGIALPDGQGVSGMILFRLQSVDLDRAANSVLADNVTAVDLRPDGSFAVDLWPNDKGERGTHYVVTAQISEGGRKAASKAEVGFARVPESGPVELSKILAPPFPAGARDVVEIVQGDSLDLAIQHVDDGNFPSSLAGVSVEAWIAHGDSLRVALSVTIIDAAAGVFEVNASPAQTSNLNGSYTLAIRLSVGVVVQITTADLIVRKVGA